MGRPEKIQSVLFDASALIGVIQGEETFACLQSTLKAIDQGAVRLVESTAILAEVLPKHKKDSAVHAKTRESLRALLEAPSTELVDVSTAVARKAGDLRELHGLKTWDAIHLSTAVIARVDVLFVRDGKFPEEYCEGVYVSGPFDIDDDKLPLR